MERRKAGVVWVVGWLAVILAGVVLARIGLVVLAQPSPGPGAHAGGGGRGVLVTRVLAVAFMICDLAISSSLVTLLLIRDRVAEAWDERRLPGSGRRLWVLLLVVTILCYLSLAPTFLFFFVKLTASGHPLPSR